MTAASHLEIVRRPEQAGLILAASRRRLLEALGQPDSAAGVARRLGLPRQRVNYHLRLLEREGLVEPVEERRKGNCVERVVRTTAKAFFISPEALGPIGVQGGGTGDRLAPATLLTVASGAIRDVVALDAKAQAAGKRLATLALTTEVTFATAENRAEFLEELVTAVGRLTAKYHTDRAPRGRSFRLIALAHPIAKRESPNE
jgi:DNA-binding transcriptional ArsR family regulator